MADTDNDKNQNLSSVLDDIQDYGPGGAAPASAASGQAEDVDLYVSDEHASRLAGDFEHGQDDYAPADEPHYQQSQGDSLDSDDSLDDMISDAEPVTPTSAFSAGRWLAMLAAALLLLAVIMGFLAYHLQTQLSGLAQQAGELAQQQAPRPVYADEHSHDSDVELAQLQQAVEELRAQLSELGSGASANEDTVDTLQQQAVIPAAEVYAAGGAPAAVTAAAEPRKVAPVEKVQVPTAVGGWFINLGSFQEEARARKWAGQVKNPPRPPQVEPVVSNGKTLYRVRISGFATRAQARKEADRLKQQWQMDSIWISDK